MLNMLVLVRHGDAEFFGPEGTDASRRLTKRGVKALARAYPAIFSQLKDEEGIRFWVSPATRALQTAEIAAGTLGIAPADFDLHESLYAQNDDEFLAELEAEGDGCVIAVGHVPFMQRMCWDLTGANVPFSKGSVAAVRFADGDVSKAELVWFEPGPDA